MRLSTIAFTVAAGLGSAVAAQEADPVALAQQQGVCGGAGVSAAETLPDGRIAVQCNPGGPPPGTEVAGGVAAGAAAGGAAAGAGAATGFAPLIGPAAAVAGIGVAAAAVDGGGSSTSDTQ